MMTHQAFHHKYGRHDIYVGTALETYKGIKIEGRNPYGDSFTPFMDGWHDVTAWRKELQFRIEHALDEDEKSQAEAALTNVNLAWRRHTTMLDNLDALGV